VAADLQEKAGPGQFVRAEVVDVTNDCDLVRWISSIVSSQEIDILVNNAGIIGPIGQLENNDWQFWQDTVAVNLLAVVRICQLLAPNFKKRGYGKIVNISGGGAASPLKNFSAYSASKAALVRFTECLAQELVGVDINAVAPGPLKTRLGDEILAAGREVVGEALFEKLASKSAADESSFKQAADLVLYLASPCSDGISGRLISALWDPWSKLSNFSNDLKNSDIYTLRRIVPEDRGKKWS
jgi:NAD(P)-dependent dehydrogenase (short-subunit alcohol dehydrogenase family)